MATAAGAASPRLARMESVADDSIVEVEVAWDPTDGAWTDDFVSFMASRPGVKSARLDADGRLIVRAAVNLDKVSPEARPALARLAEHTRRLDADD